jgi:thiol-disulfide isomerase/thioredoxin
LPQSFGKGLVYLIAYALGLGLVLLAISLLGQRITEKLGAVTDPKGWLKKGIGILFLLIGIFVLSGLDKKIQTGVINSGVFDITKVEQKLLQNTEAMPIGEQVENTSMLTAEQKALQFPKYKEIARPEGYVNTNNLPITIGQYVGKKVILLDILTYSCINCQRTFPYLNDWYTKYEDRGLIIIGIHTPEFAFEHLQKNVEEAAKQFGLKFPLVLDNNYGTWNAYGNNYWPRKYLIDIDGYVVYDHIGEGNYDVTENKIVELLNERAKRLGEPAVTLGVDQMPETKLGGFGQSPETYLGSARSEYRYTGNGNLPKNQYSLTGQWDEKSEYAELISESGSIRYHFTASKVHLVASSGIPVNAQIFLDGKLITANEAGEDVKDGVVNFSEARLYTLVDLKDSPGEHILEIKMMQKGLEAYAFTFS